MEISNPNLNIYSYKTETAVFTAIMHEETIMAVI